jgi:hypothetical protein
MKEKQHIHRMSYINNSFENMINDTKYQKIYNYKKSSIKIICELYTIKTTKITN